MLQEGQERDLFQIEVHPFCQEYKTQPGVMVNAFNPSTREARKASLNSRPVKNTYRDPVLKK